MGRRAPASEAASIPNGEPKATNGDSKVAGEEPSVPAPLTTAQKLAASNTAAASTEIPPDSYAREAKHFTEVRVLNRDVSAALPK
jgi:staphylococcal nuclease domain-containing protein 1